MAGTTGRWLAAVVRLMAVVCVLGVAGRAAAQQPAMLDLSVNRMAQGQAYVLLDGADAWIELKALEDAGLTGLAGDRREWSGRTMVRLASLAPGVGYELDEVALAVRLTVQPSQLGGTAINLGSARPDGIDYHRVPSAFVNYGASLTTAGTQALSFETGMSAGSALLTSTMFSENGLFRRGLTALTIDDRTRLNRYVIGDAVASTGALGGAVQMAGVTVSRDFSLDPYFVRFPTIGLSGAVMTPSRVEVYVNNQLVRVEQLPPGVYSLNGLNLPVGTADTRVVVRDAFGGEQEFNSSYYISQGVLARGLQQFAYSAGAERLDLFDSSWNYGRPMFLGLHRIGLTDSITLGGRVEASSDLASGGPMITTQIGHFGEIEAIAAFSHSAEGAGYSASMAYEFSGRAGSVSAAVRRYSPDYSTLSTLRTLMRPRLDLGTTATMRVNSRMTTGASWQSLDYYLETPSLRRGAVTSSVSLGQRCSLFLSVNRSLYDGKWSTGAFAGLSLSITNRQNANLSVEHDGGKGRMVAEVQRSLPTGTGFGYRVQGAATDMAQAANLDAEVRGQASFGSVDLRQTVVDGHAAALADVSGGLVLIGGGVHMTRAIQDGYALVRVPDVPHVETFVSNQPVGRTDRHGNLIVPNLLPYFGNRLSIADSDVPLDRDVTRTEMLLAPPYRGGAVALFPAPRPWRVAGRIVVLRDREVVTPSNWRLRLDGPHGAIETALGSEGAFYIEGLAPGDYSAVVGSTDSECRFVLHVPASADPVIRTGVTTCAVDTTAGRR